MGGEESETLAAIKIKNMSPTVVNTQYPHLKEIMKIDLKLSKLPWYKFKERKLLKKEKQDLVDYGWNLGVDLALTDLVEAGILKRAEVSR